MKNKKLIITLIILLSFISIAIIIFMIGLIKGNIKMPRFGFHFSKESNQLVINETYNQTFNNINIASSASNIYVKSTKEKDVKVVVYSSENKVDVKTNNNELLIESKNKCTSFCVNMTIDKIEVYLPSNFNNNILINNNYGDVNLDEFLNSNIEVNENSGDVIILGGKNVTVNNDYGDIKLEKATKADIEASAGDIEIGTVNDIKVENSYGDININKVLNYLEVNDDCGDIEIDEIILNEDSTINNNLGDIKINDTNQIYIDAKISLGDIKINNNYNKSDVTLKIKNDCGDITINN